MICLQEGTLLMTFPARSLTEKKGQQLFKHMAKSPLKVFKRRHFVREEVLSSTSNGQPRDSALAGAVRWPRVC